MPQADIQEWMKKLKEKGVIGPKGGSQYWADTLAPDGSIFQLFLGPRYIRVVWNDTNRPDPQKPFAVWDIRSVNYPAKPKTDFLGTTQAPIYMNVAEVDKLLFL